MKNNNQKRFGGVNGYVLGHMLASSLANYGEKMLKDCNEKWFLKMLDRPDFYEIRWVTKKKIVITLKSDPVRNYIIWETNKGAILSFRGLDLEDVVIRKFYKR